MLPHHKPSQRHQHHHQYTIIQPSHQQCITTTYIIIIRTITHHHTGISYQHNNGTPTQCINNNYHNNRSSTHLAGTLQHNTNRIIGTRRSQIINSAITIYISNWTMVIPRTTTTPVINVITSRSTSSSHQFKQ